MALKKSEKPVRIFNPFETKRVPTPKMSAILHAIVPNLGL